MHHPFNDYTPAISQAEASVKIDQLVDDVLRIGGQAYIPQSHSGMPYRQTMLGADLDYLSQMLPCLMVEWTTTTARTWSCSTTRARTSGWSTTSTDIHALIPRLAVATCQNQRP